MTPEQFCYWAQGFFEIAQPKSLSETQIQIIQDHLDLVFQKVTPDRKEKSFDDIAKEVYPENPKDSLYCNKVDEEIGWKLLDTRFTGISSSYLC